VLGDAVEAVRVASVAAKVRQRLRDVRDMDVVGLRVLIVKLPPRVSLNPRTTVATRLRRRCCVHSVLPLIESGIAPPRLPLMNQSNLFHLLVQTIFTAAGN
jgi:hypothetical protein